MRVQSCNWIDGGEPFAIGYVMSLVRGAMSLVRGAMSLVRGAMSLVRGATSLVRGFLKKSNQTTGSLQDKICCGNIIYIYFYYELIIYF